VRIFSILSALLFTAALPISASRQSLPERFWIAGRYDGNRVIVYFDAVKFAGNLPSDAVKIASPVARGFFDPVALPESYTVQFQSGRGADPFKLGDEYDLLVGDGIVTKFKLTTFVGFQGDEFVGNDSYIGAIGTLDRPDTLLFQPDYYVVRTYDPGRIRTAAPNGASLLKTTVPFDGQVQIAAVLAERLKSDTSISVSEAARNAPPAFVIQAFTLADGSLRYHVLAEWRAGRERGYQLLHSFAAWMAPEPKLRILAIDRLTFGSDAAGEQNLLNVVDLGDGRTGIILRVLRGESIGLRLVEYREGAGLAGMPVLQTISFAE
jgi:hypothetical protein